MVIDTPIDLLAGHDYVLMGMGGDVTLKGPGGVVIVTTGNEFNPQGTEFHAQYTATYFIEYDSDTLDVHVVPDCRGDLTTLCHLAVNHAKDGIFQWDFDTDTFKVYLNRAYTYVFSMTGHSGNGDNSKQLRIIDSRGVVLSDIYTDNDPLSTLTFHPSRTGTYYIQGQALAEDYGFPYTLTLRIKR